MSPSGPALSIVQYVGKEVSSDPWTLNTIFGPKKKVLDSTNGVSSKSIKIIHAHAQLNVTNKLYTVTLRCTPNLQHTHLSDAST